MPTEHVPHQQPRPVEQTQLLKDAHDLIRMDGDVDGYLSYRKENDGWGADQRTQFLDVFDAELPKVRTEMLQQEADEKYRDERREMMEATPAFLRDALVSLESGIRDVGSLVNRAGTAGAQALGYKVNDRTDDINKQTQLNEEVRQEFAEGDNINDMYQTAVGGLRSVMMMAASGGRLGTGGMTALFMAHSGNQALTDATLAGIEGEEKWEYVGKAAAIEGLVMSAFNRLGLPGVEKLIGTGQLTRAGFKEILRATGISVLQELPEEYIAEALGQINKEAHGVSESLTPEQWMSLIQDTTLQTLFTSTFIGGLQGIGSQDALRAQDALVQNISEQYQMPDADVRKALKRAVSVSEKSNLSFETALGKAVEEESLKTDGGLALWAMQHGDVADAIMAKESPTRNEFRDGGLPKMNLPERQELAERLRRLHAKQEQEQKQEQETQAPQEQATTADYGLPPSAQILLAQEEELEAPTVEAQDQAPAVETPQEATEAPESVPAAEATTDSSAAPEALPLTGRAAELASLENLPKDEAAIRDAVLNGSFESIEALRRKRGWSTKRADSALAGIMSRLDASSTDSRESAEAQAEATPQQRQTLVKGLKPAELGAVAAPTNEAEALEQALLPVESDAVRSELQTVLEADAEGGSTDEQKAALYQAMKAEGMSFAEIMDFRREVQNRVNERTGAMIHETLAIPEEVEARVDPAVLGRPAGQEALRDRKQREAKRQPPKRKPRVQQGQSVGQRLIQGVDVIQAVRDSFPGLSVKGSATIRKKGRSGWYNSRLQEISLVDERDVDTAMHELGHHLDKRLGMWSKQASLPESVKQELTTLGMKAYPDIKKPPEAGYRAEGFAEFIREYLTGGDTRSLAPGLHKWFNTQYLPANPKQAKKLRNIELLITRMVTQSSQDTVRAFRQPVKQAWTSERVAGMVAGLEDRHVDRLLPLLRGMEKSGIDPNKIPPSQNPYLKAVAYARSAGGRAIHSALEGTYTLTGSLTGGSLKEALAPVVQDERLEDWVDYAVARRALDLHDRDVNPGITKRDAQATVDKLQSKQFEDVTEAVTDWSRRQLYMLVESGRMTQQEFDDIQNLNPVYVPFARQFQEGELKSGKGSSLAKGVNRIKGSGREIHNPIDALIMQSEKMTQVAMQSDIIRTLVQLYDSNQGDTKGMMMREVEAPQDATMFGIDKLKAAVKQAADNAGLTDEQANVARGAARDLADALTQNWDGSLTVFQQADNYKGSRKITSAVIDGKRRWFEIEDQALLDIIENITKDKILPGTLGKISRSMVGLQRLGATGVNASFGLIRNPIRDTLTAAITSDYHFHFPIVSTIIGTLKDIQGVETSKLYHAMGVDLAGRVGQDIRLAKRMSRRVQAKGKAEAFVTGGVINGVREFLSRTEVGPRLLEFEGARDYGLKQEGWTEADANLLATAAAKDVTVNFSRAGSQGAAINEVILFWNAAIQSVNKALRTVGLAKALPWQKHQSRSIRATQAVAKSAAFLSAAALASYFRNRDDEWWQELPPHEKWNYIHVRMGGIDENGNPEAVMRVPLPFEFGAVFGSLPVAALENQRHEGALGEALDNAAGNAIPVSFEGENVREVAHSLFRNIAMLGPLADVMANMDWKGDEIVNPFMEASYLEKDLYDPSTTQFAVQLGELINSNALGFQVSPAHLEHMMNGYTGGLYRRIAKGVESISDPSKATAEPSNLPVVGTLFMRENTSRVTGDFYDELDQLKKKRGSGEATLAEIGQLHEGNKLKRELTPLWDARRQAHRDHKGKVASAKELEIMDEVQEKVRAFNERTDFERIGMATVAMSATAPSADREAIESARQLLAGQSLEDVQEALKAQIKRRGGNTRIRKSNGGRTPYGERVKRLEQMLKTEEEGTE